MPKPPCPIWQDTPKDRSSHKTSIPGNACSISVTHCSVTSLEELEARLAELLDTIQREMLERARVHRDTHTYTAANMEEFERLFTENTGFVKAMWCGEQACEDKIKEELAVTSRCIPFEQENISDVCVCCGKPAKKMVYWGRAY